MESRSPVGKTERERREGKGNIDNNNRDKGKGLFIIGDPLEGLLG